MLPPFLSFGEKKTTTKCDLAPEDGEGGGKRNFRKTCCCGCFAGQNGSDAKVFYLG